MAEWWLGPTTADQCGHIPECIYMYMYMYMYHRSTKNSDCTRTPTHHDTVQVCVHKHTQAHATLPSRPLFTKLEPRYWLPHIHAVYFSEHPIHKCTKMYTVDHEIFVVNKISLFTKV